MSLHFSSIGIVVFVVKSGLSFGLAPAELSPNIVGLMTNGQDRNGSALTSPMSSPSVTATPVRDQAKSSMPTGSSSSSKDPSRHKDGHGSSSGHRSSSSSSKPNGSSSHSKDHKHSSHSSSSSRPKDASENQSKDADKHRVSSSSLSSAHKDKDHSKSKDHHSSSHSKSHSSSSNPGDKSKVDGSSSSSSKHKEDSSHKPKHSSSSSSSHRPSDDKDRHHSSKSHSDKKPHADKPREKTEHKGSSLSAVKQSASLESGSNVSVKIDGGSIKMKIEKSPTGKQHDQVVFTLCFYFLGGPSRVKKAKFMDIRCLDMNLDYFYLFLTMLVGCSVFTVSYVLILRLSS